MENFHRTLIDFELYNSLACRGLNISNITDSTYRSLITKVTLDNISNAIDISMEAMKSATQDNTGTSGL